MFDVFFSMYCHSQDECPRQGATFKDTSLDIKTIVIQNKKDNIKVSLWKEFVKEEIKTGDFVVAKNCGERISEGKTALYNMSN